VVVESSVKTSAVLYPDEERTRRDRLTLAPAWDRIECRFPQMLTLRQMRANCYYLGYPAQLRSVLSTPLCLEAPMVCLTAVVLDFPGDDP
jgi:hypothetical protein